MKHILLFEELSTDEIVKQNLAKRKDPLYNSILEYFISGDTGPLMRKKLYDSVIKHFNGKVPDKYKYAGPVYRYYGFRTRTAYEKSLKNGITESDSDKSFFSTSKTPEGLAYFSAGVNYKKGYNYFIKVKFDVDKKDVFLDVNKFIKDIFDGEFRDYDYTKEEEVLILTDTNKVFTKFYSKGKTYK